MPSQRGGAACQTRRSEQMSSLQPTSEYEIVIALVGAVGTDLDRVHEIIRDRLRHFGYQAELVKISDLIRSLAGSFATIVEQPEHERIDAYMTAGNEARRRWHRNDVWALAAIADVARRRGDPS